MNNQPNNQPASPADKKQLQIKISDEVLKGNYANAMSVGHTKEEFMLDFMNLSPHQGVGIVSSRVIMSPGHVKRVISALQDNLKKYEGQFGNVEQAEAPNNEIGFKAEN